MNCQEKLPFIFVLKIPKAVKVNKVMHGQIETWQYVKKQKTRCIKRISVSKHQKCDSMSTVQTVQLKQLLFICGKLQIGNGFLQCYQISHNTRIRWGFFYFFLASSYLVTNIKCKAGGRVRLMNELRHQAKKKTRQKTRSRCSHSSLSQSWYKSSLNLSHYAFLHYWGHLAIALLFLFKKENTILTAADIIYYILSKNGR